MRRFCLGIASVVLAISFAGCSEPTPEDEKTQFKPTDTSPLNNMQNQMKAAAKSPTLTTTPSETRPVKGGGKSAEDKPAETKPAETKPAEKKAG